MSLSLFSISTFLYALMCTRIHTQPLILYIHTHIPSNTSTHTHSPLTLTPHGHGVARLIVKGVHLYLLSTPLVGSLVLVIDSAKVGDDDGHGQGDYQHPAQGSDRADTLPRHR